MNTKKYQNRFAVDTVLPFAIAAVFFTVSTTASATALEEVVVTAQKVSQNVQDVPIAVTAFTSTDMQTKGISDVSKMSDFAPNVTLDAGTPFSGSDAVLSAYIRGIGQNDFAFNQDPGVGVYVDGVYLARSVGSNLGMLDVDRVEILKGPQGTLFGRNTIGGAISIITHTPGDQFTAKGEVTGGSFDRLDFQGSMDIPITSNLLTTVAFSRKSRDGYQKRIPFPTPVAGSSGIPDCDALAAGTPCPVTQQPYYTQPAAGYRTAKRAGGQNQWSVRGKILWLATDKLKVTAALDYTNVDQQAQPASPLYIDPNRIDPSTGNAGLGSLYNGCLLGAPIGVLCTQPRLNARPIPTPVTPLPPLGGVNVDGNPNNNQLPYDSRFITGNPDTTYSTGNNFSKLTNWGMAGTIDYDVNSHMHIKNIVAYRRLYWQTGIDADGSPLNIFQLSFTMPQHQLSEELQFTGTTFNDRVDYAFGFYYFHEKGHLHDFVTFPGALLMIDGPNDLATTSEAAYGHLNIRMSDQFTFVAGGRFTVEHKEFQGFQSDGNGLFYKLVGCFPATAPGFVPGTDCQGSLAAVTPFHYPSTTEPYRMYPPGKRTLNFKNFSPVLGVQFYPRDDMMFYLTMSQGYKTGSWTTRLTTPQANYDNSLHFNPEKAITEEVGMKSEWFNRQLRLNVDGFHTMYTDIQLNSQIGTSPTLVNAGDARMWGFEIESQAQIGYGLSMAASVGYIDARYTRLNNVADNGVPITLNNKLPKTPKWKVYVGPQYVKPMPFGGEVQLNMNYTYISKVYNDLGNTPQMARPPADMIDASATYRFPGDKYAITVGGTNLTDERNILSGQNQGGIAETFGVYNAPREWYARLSASY